MRRGLLLLHRQLSSWGTAGGHFLGPRIMPQTRMWTVAMGLCWQLVKGFTLLRACCPSCW